MMRSTVVSWLCVIVLAAAACSLPDTPTLQPTPNPLAGGILAALDVVGRRFESWVIEAETIQQILEPQQGKSAATIPNGRVLHGPVPGAHNAPWSWHLDPKDIEMAKFTVEVSDGSPSFVESEVDYSVDTVQGHCPLERQVGGCTGLPASRLRITGHR